MAVPRALRELNASFAAADVLVLCYHAVRSRARFETHLEVLAEAGIRVLSMPEFLAWCRAPTREQSPAALITFDGVYRTQLAHAVPALATRGLPATFFAVSYGLDGAGPGHRADLRSLAAAGHTIGCHTETHPDLTTLSAADLEREVAGSKRALEDALGAPVTTFAYPDGAWDARVARAVRDAGFHVAFTVDLGGVRAGDDLYVLPRVPVLGEPGRAAFAAYVRGARGVAGPLLLWWKVLERLPG
jgi:peptidoglycan/xylan/chitin deacetylase (PgdA/CDA1 family)